MGLFSLVANSINAVKKSKNVAAGTVATGAAVAPEDAEAGALSTIQNLLRLGFLKLDAADNPSAVKAAQTRYNNAYKNNPAFRQREKLRQDLENNTVTTDLGERPIIQPHDLVGKTGVPVMGDATTIGRIENIGGVEVDVPIQGGPGFPQQNADDGIGWASMNKAAEKKQENFDLAADRTGNDVVAITGRMGDEATNFSSPVAEALFKQVKQLPIRKRDIKAFDEDLRSFRPNWVGLEHPDALDQLMGRNGYPMDGAGKLRSLFSSRMDQSKFRDVGFPRVSEIHDEIMIPELRNANIGDSGYSVFDAKPGQGTSPFENHASYDTAIPGDYSGGFEVPVPARVMYPNTFKQLDQAVNKKGQPLKEQEKLGSLVMNPKLYEVFDNQWADNVQDFINKHKKAIATTAIVTSGAANASDADAALLGTVSKLGQKLQKNLEKAKQMEADGKPPNEIWDETGWEKNAADGEWRVEYNTKDTTVVPQNEGTWPISDIIRDEELLSMYDDPNWKQNIYDITAKATEEGSRNKTSLKDIEIEFDPYRPSETGYLAGNKMVVGSGDQNYDDMRGTIMHELQHAIQEREGFARGGSPGEFVRLNDDFNALYGDGKRMDKLIAEMQESISKDPMNAKIEDRELLTKAIEIRARMRQFDAESQGGKLDPNRMYHNLAGEVEARNVERRDLMTPQQTRNFRPEASELMYDTAEPRNKQIVRQHFKDGHPDELMQPELYAKTGKVSTNRFSDGQLAKIFAERDARQGKSRAWRRANPASPALREYSQSQVVPTLKNIGVGAVEGLAGGLDFLGTGVARMGMGNPYDPMGQAMMLQNLPKVETATELTKPLSDLRFLDGRDPNSEKQRESARMFGSFFSPI